MNDLMVEGWGLIPNQIFQELIGKSCRNFSAMPWHELWNTSFEIGPLVVTSTVSRQDASCVSQSLNQIFCFHYFKELFVWMTLQR